MNERSSGRLNPYTEGDARTEAHAKACGDKWLLPGCRMSCRCWCHGITKHPNGALRPDVTTSENPPSPSSEVAP